jgi:hypothetical protein
MYLAARELAGRRAGLIAAALAGNESLARWRNEGACPPRCTMQ